MKPFLSACWIIVLLVSCNPPTEPSFSSANYIYDVGEILFDPNTDDPDFELCDSTRITTSRAALLLDGDRNNVSEKCKALFIYNEEFKSFDGFVTIRFMVNCHNEADRFRLTTMDWDFSLKECPNSLQNHLLEIVKSLEKWEHSARVDADQDVAKFINFKIVKGDLVNVLQ